MKKVLVIYDLEGTIISLKYSEPLPEEPVGVPFLWVDVDEGKYIDINGKVDVEAEPHVVPLLDIPKSEVEVLRDDLDNAILELSMMISMGGM